MALTLDTMPPDQRTMLQLLQDHGWHQHQMGMLKFEEYRDRFTWLHEHMDRPLRDHDSTDIASLYRWYGMPTHSSMGLVDGVLLAFRDPADRTMFALRWS
jgi:hypothetical protein